MKKLASIIHSQLHGESFCKKTLVFDMNITDVCPSGPIENKPLKLFAMTWRQIGNIILHAAMMKKNH